VTSRRFVTIARASAARLSHPCRAVENSLAGRGQRGGGRGGRRKEKKSELDRSSGYFLGGVLTTLNFRIRASKRKREKKRRKKREREREKREGGRKRDRKKRREKKGKEKEKRREASRTRVRRVPRKIRAKDAALDVRLEYRYRRATERANLKTSRLSGSASRLLRASRGLFRREKRDKRQTAAPAECPALSL